MNNEWLIEQDEKRGYTFISYDRMWSIFEEEYIMKYKEIQSLMRILLLKHLKRERLKPVLYLLGSITN